MNTVIITGQPDPAAEQVTRAQAEAVLAAIREQFSYALGDGYPEPQLIENWQYGLGACDGCARFAIVWEEGPDDWALRAGDGGFDEHLTVLAQDVKPGLRIETPPARMPEGVYCEAIFSYAASIQLV